MTFRFQLKWNHEETSPFRPYSTSSSLLCAIILTLFLPSLCFINVDKFHRWLITLGKPKVYIWMFILFVAQASADQKWNGEHFWHVSKTALASCEKAEGYILLPDILLLLRVHTCWHREVGRRSDRPDVPSSWYEAPDNKMTGLIISLNLPTVCYAVIYIQKEQNVFI